KDKHDGTFGFGRCLGNEHQSFAWYSVDANLQRLQPLIGNRREAARGDDDGDKNQLSARSSWTIHPSHGAPRAGLSNASVADHSGRRHRLVSTETALGATRESHPQVSIEPHNTVIPWQIIQLQNLTSSAKCNNWLRIPGCLAGKDSGRPVTWRGRRIR